MFISLSLSLYMYIYIYIYTYAFEKEYLLPSSQDASRRHASACQPLILVVRCVVCYYQYLPPPLSLIQLLMNSE